MRISFFLIIVLLGVTSSSCDNATAVTPGTRGGNVVTGMNITGETGPEVIAVLGNPDFPDPVELEPEQKDPMHNIPHYLDIYTPYPNPSDGNFNFNADLPQAMIVEIWMETAEFIGQGPPLFGGSKRTFQHITILSKTELVAGQHSFRINEKSFCRGGRLQDGFYRIFMKADNKHIFWRDLYIGGCKPLPNIFDNLSWRNYY